MLSELPAHRSDLLGERGAEHHDLLLVRRLLEYGLHVLAHVELLQHLIALVQYEPLQVVQLQLLLLQQLQHPARRAHHYVGHLALQQLAVLRDGDAAEEHLHLHVRQVLGEAEVLLADLIGQLAGVAEDEGVHLAFDGYELLQRGEDEHCGLCSTHAAQSSRHSQ